MRTAIILGAGVLFLALCVGFAVMWGNKSAATKAKAVSVFAFLWFLLAAANMYVGVAQAGYSFMEELPIFLLIFLVPAAIGLFLRWKFF